MPTSAPRRAASLDWLAAALLVAVTLASYGNSFNGVLVFDDQEALGANPSIRTMWPLARALDAPKDTPLAGRPVANFTFALNYALAPVDVREALGVSAAVAPDVAAAVHRNLWGYHATNLAVHIAAGLLLFGLVRRSLRFPTLAAQFGAHATPIAFLVAALWMVHPLTTASVTYVAQRVESLAGLFYLLTLYAAMRAHESPRRSWWQSLSIVACALGVGSKETVATAPLAVILFDYVIWAAPTAGDGRSAWPRTGARARAGFRWGFYGGLAGTWLILAAIVATNPRPNSVGWHLRGWSPWTYLLTQAGVLVHYLQQAIWPSNLALDYAWPQARLLGEVWLQALLVVLVLALAVVAVVRRHPAGVCLGLFFLVLAPTSSVLPIVTEVAADHRMYLPLAALIALVVPAIYAGIAWLERLRGRALPAVRQGASAAGVVLVATLAVVTIGRNRDYHSVEAIWADTLAKRDGSVTGHVNYGAALLLQQRLPEAEAHFRQAVALDERSVQAHANLGVALCAQQKYEEGIAHLQRALELAPDYADARRNLAEAYASQGLFSKALPHYRALLDATPDDVELLNVLGWILATANDPPARNGALAVKLAERATRLTHGTDPSSLDTLAAAYAEVGDFAAARTAAGQALEAATRQGQHDLAREIDVRLKLYAAGQKFRQGPEGNQ